MTANERAEGNAVNRSLQSMYRGKNICSRYYTISIDTLPHSTIGNSPNHLRSPITTATSSGKFAHAQRAASCTQGLLNSVKTNRTPVCSDNRTAWHKRVPCVKENCHAVMKAYQRSLIIASRCLTPSGCSFSIARRVFSMTASTIAVSSLIFLM